MRKTRIPKNCLVCGGEFETWPYSIRNGHGLYCSVHCSGLARRGKPNGRKGKPNHKLRGAGNAMANPIYRAKAKANSPRGENHPSWKGGVTSIYKTIRKSPEYVAWRTAVFERDNYTCVRCGSVSGNGRRNDIQADHIHPFSLYPELRFELSNGRTLCLSCHRATETFGSKVLKLNKGVKDERVQTV